MEWDKNFGNYNYHGLELDTKPEIKHFVRLYKENFEFDVEVTNIDADMFSGKVIRIGPKATLEEIGIRRGDTVTFKENQIQRLSKNA